MFNPKLHSPGVSICGLGANPRWPRCKSTLMWVEFAVGSLLCFERFFSKYSGFLLSLEANPFKFLFDLELTETFQRVLKNSKVLRG